MNINNQIIYLNTPSSVSMADDWYDYGTVDHFWVRHRNAVFDRHFGNTIYSSQLIGEIGCGNGLMLSHISRQYNKAVDGFELNLSALKMCPTIPGTLYVYDILTKNPELVEKYNFLMLIDVIEHIKDETPFLLAVKEHLKPGGLLLIGVPMRQHLFSAYDLAAGHYRRYSTKDLKSLVQNAGFKVKKVIQWGHIYIPLLMLRKQMLKNSKPEDIIRKGFKSSSFTNACLSPIRYLDFIPTFRTTGTSCFLLAEKINNI